MKGLRLRSEVLAELSAGELGSVAGAVGPDSGPSCPVVDCVTLTFHPRCYTGLSCPVTV